MDRQEDDLRPAQRVEDFGCGLDSIHARHIDVHKDDIRLQQSGFFDGFFAVAGFAANSKGMVVEKSPDGIPDQRVVVDYEYSRGQLCIPVIPVADAADGWAAPRDLSMLYWNFRARNRGMPVDASRLGICPEAPLRWLHGIQRRTRLIAGTRSVPTSDLAMKFPSPKSRARTAASSVV